MAKKIYRVVVEFDTDFNGKKMTKERALKRAELLKNAYPDWNLYVEEITPLS